MALATLGAKESGDEKHTHTLTHAIELTKFTHSIFFFIFFLVGVP